MSCKAVIFDLDGTLLDTLEDIGDCMNHALAGMGLATRSREDYRCFIGGGAAALACRVLPESEQSEETISACLERFRRQYARRWNRATRPYEGIPEMLDRVAMAGIKLSVHSNKPHEFAVKCVRNYFGRWQFVKILGQRDGLPDKPHPAGALEIARCAGVLPSEVIYVGDTPVDMKTARAAGMYPVGVQWGFRSRQELKDNGAGAILGKPAELLELIGG